MKKLWSRDFFLCSLQELEGNHLGGLCQNTPWVTHYEISYDPMIDELFLSKGKR